MTHPSSVHCPDCGATVPAAADGRAVACAACGCAFDPWGLPTTPGRGPRAGAPRPAPAAPEEAPPVGSSLGGHRLERVIGRGGMGTVWEAHDARRGRVAVKVLPPELARDPAFVARFAREARVLMGLSHPHLVEVYEHGQEGERCFFVMEYVRGESLRRRLERGPLPWREAVRIARDVLSGLGYAHGRGVVHRDLKPENVLLDDAGRARIVDFGLSRIVRGEAAEALSRLTRTDVILGTYEYMAPEQRLGAAVDERADLFALGVILYELLTGSLPLGRFEAPSVLRPGTPAALDAIVLRALSTSPGDRHPSAVALREALETVASEATPAAPAPWDGGAAVPPALPPALPPTHLAGLAARATAGWSAARWDAARRVLRHTEILATADRAIAVLSILFVLGVFSRGRAGIASGWEWFLPAASSWSGITIVTAILLLRQAGRLDRLEPRARTWQIVLSVPLVVLMPPIGTAMGLYGILVMTGLAARDAFAVGREALLGAAVVAAERERAVRRHAARGPAADTEERSGPRLFLVGIGLVAISPMTGLLVLPLLVLGSILAFVGLFHWMGLRRLAVVILVLLLVGMGLFLVRGGPAVPAPFPRLGPHAPTWVEEPPDAPSPPQPPLVEPGRRGRGAGERPR